MRLLDPRDITRFDRSERELHRFALFCYAVQGKSSTVMVPKVVFLEASVPGPFFRGIAQIDDATLREKLVFVRLGCYAQRTKQLRGMAEAIQGGLDLASAPLKALEGLMGLKSSRFFLLHSRPGVRVAVLDTHVLAWLRSLGVAAPKSTPTSPTSYARLEALFLDLCDERGVDPATLDLQVWSDRARK